MKDVKNPLVISEYYPRILPPESAVAPAPVTRLTPHFHDIVIQNVTATGDAMAGAIVGLPEAPVTDIVLQNVNLSGEKGLSIGYANVTGQNVKVQAAQGDAIIKWPAPPSRCSNAHTQGRNQVAAAFSLVLVSFISTNFLNCLTDSPRWPGIPRPPPESAR